MPVTFISAPVPFIIVGNRRALTDVQIHEDQAVADFVKIFSLSFERDYTRSIWLFIEPTVPDA